MASSLLTSDSAATHPGTAQHTSGPRTLAQRFDAVRAQTEHLCVPLDTEDYVVSSMADVSPTKWHLAHTSWFFETFVLGPHAPEYVSPNPRYAYLFNSYYVQAGERHCRAKRGLVTRPTVREVFEYRAHVNEAMRDLLERLRDDPQHPAHRLIELGLHHEQQHQELLVTDIKHVFWMNPLRPVYRERPQGASLATTELKWRSFAGGVHRIGHEGDGFAFDNEGPAHREFLEDFVLASRLVTNGEYLEFMRDGGYERSELWLSPGLAIVQDRGWKAPFYWEREGDDWTEFTLAGTRPVALNEPVCHVSYYEADAFARWAKRRLPTEAEWEVAARGAPVEGTFVESERFHPAPARATRDGEHALAQLYGDVWQWTQSAYVGYPGFKPDTGAIGEYNGKWMADQWVLRGASCATPESHARLTYRNFFPSDARWQFMGIRLADHA
jgi:ergothioneine biosynthesis protein EgtB